MLASFAYVHCSLKCSQALLFYLNAFRLFCSCDMGARGESALSIRSLIAIGNSGRASHASRLQNGICVVHSGYMLLKYGFCFELTLQIVNIFYVCT